MADNLEGSININIQAGRYKAGYVPVTRDLFTLISANSPIPIQVQWAMGSSDANSYEATAAGDLVNIVLEVWMGNLYPDTAIFSGNTNLPNMTKVAEISKSRDLPVISGDVPPHSTGSSTYNHYNFHNFTFDIQPICADLLSYTLCPMGKATIESPDYGGFNGGVIGNNISGMTSPLQSSLGAFRWIDFRVSAQVLDANLELTDWVAVGGNNNGKKKYKSGQQFAIINNTHQWTDAHNNEKYIIKGGTTLLAGYAQFFTNCPNWSRDLGGRIREYTKPVKQADDSEFLHFYVNEGLTKANGDVDLGDFAVKVTSDSGDVVFLRGFNNQLGYAPSVSNPPSTVNWKRYCVQNVSPQIILTADPTFNFGNGEFEAVAVMQRITGLNYQEVSETRFYRLDTENATPYGDVRFHWLNRAGGIDSYTAKRDVVEGISVSKSTIERKVGERMFLKIRPDLFGDSNGSNTYQPSVDVMNVDASKNNSVYTEPLNSDVAGWLEELITSPNVWIELDNEASRRAYGDLDVTDTSSSNYFPVIITNNSVETVNEAEGLVKFNIEYTHSHKLNIQRN